ncbi:ethanolamine ammonia-lyase subunit EutC [Flavihumibacter petaseus]|uniref:Ethanolamine ammonia-lyase small subunit n=1 Tax=Flavihumibacter petaseus NBRC 106054 TaxID=1220578 RepID=A0A0E9MWI3_9BACT|nr:ethanolamine ammonia-lyase subunit EutC [Flavihumibacter petaseus]GAO41465.1 ethanolamine ammonia-lyase small subunit [Flavihumibacter petaseus NBRC 106054]
MPLPVIHITAVQEDAWQTLRAFTNARIALGSAGTAIPVKEVLQFRMAHANARDAVFSILEVDRLSADLQRLRLPFLVVHSQAADRTIYLQRPDLGRRLNPRSAERLLEHQHDYDVVIIVADGLSATAINNNALPVLINLVGDLQQNHYVIAPIVIAREARVALGDEIASLLRARLSIMLIGERPGLSAPASMGAYLTYDPVAGLNDERRNCISNIHAKGLQPNLAAQKIYYLCKEALRLKISGVQLKDEATGISGSDNFQLPKTT